MSTEANRCIEAVIQNLDQLPATPKYEDWHADGFIRIDLLPAETSGELHTNQLVVRRHGRLDNGSPEIAPVSIVLRRGFDRTVEHFAVQRQHHLPRVETSEVKLSKQRLLGRFVASGTCQVFEVDSWGWKIPKPGRALKPSETLEVAQTAQACIDLFMRAVQGDRKWYSAYYVASRSFQLGKEVHPWKQPAPKDHLPRPLNLPRLQAT